MSSSREFDSDGNLVREWVENAPPSDDLNQSALQASAALDTDAAAVLTAQVKAATNMAQMRTAMLALIDQISE